MTLSSCAPARAGACWVALAGLVSVAGLAGCAGVTVSTIDTRTYVAEQRGDVLSTGRLSRATSESLRALGVEAAGCELDPAPCARALAGSQLVSDEERLSALAELWLQRALRFTRAGPGAPKIAVPTSIENLSDRSLFLRLADTMPISPAVQYHSIIGNHTPDRPLEDSDDGVVPFRSAHRPGAVSEKVIPSWHNVQETPEAILELRRILRTHPP
jgi:hypothetical protein